MRSIPERRTSAVPAATVRATWRYITGSPMDGVPRTDAGWLTAGTRPLSAGGRVSRWSLLPRAERAAVRVGATGAAGASLWGLQDHAQATENGMVSAGALASIVAGYQAARWAGNVPHVRNWVRPLHLALEGPLGLPPGTVLTSYLHIPRDYPQRTDVGRIDLPAAFTGADGSASTIAHVVRTKLGLSDARIVYKLEGRRPHLLIQQTPRPPAKVLFAEPEVRELADASRESAPLIGVGPEGARVGVDLDADSPHVLVSASTGGGKSVITRTMGAQMLHHGSQMVVLDFKRHSHKWARGLPNVEYCRDIEDIHDALVMLGKEGHRRNIIVDDWEGAEGEEPVGPRMGIILEEANATISKLKRYWTAIREKSDPKESPAIDALREILFMGRAVKMHVLLVAQSATAAALGGPEVRECFATRILARYTRNAWMMLVPEVQPIPRSTRHVGRAQVVLGGVASETQVMFMTPIEAREWAVSGVVAPAVNLYGRPAPDVTSHRHAGPSTSYDGVPMSRDVTPRLTLVKDGQAPEQAAPAAAEPVRYSLAAAAREGIVPLSADALRQAKKRDPEFPPSDDGKWTADALRKWHRNRPGSAESTTA